MTLAISDLGEVDCAAALWLQRLRQHDRLPEKGLLETLRRQEKQGRHHAEAAVLSERNRANFAVECLAKERSDHHEREQFLKDVQEALKQEQLRRADAEASLALERKTRSEVEEARAAEVRQRVAAEARLAKSKMKVQELTRVLEDDESLRVLDDFRQKLESQRREIASLRQQLSAAKDETAAKAAMVEQGRMEFSEGQEKWTRERLHLISHMSEQKQELMRAQRELVQLQEAGLELQVSAERVAQHALQAQMAAHEMDPRPDADELVQARSHGQEMEREALHAKEELVKAREELVEMRHAGASLQAAVQGVLQMCQILQEFTEPRPVDETVVSIESTCP